MSSCFGGAGGRTYGFELEIVKPTSAPSSSTSSSRSSSSPSSTLSESSNSALAISTKKARTPRKRPNQTYTEAAALLARIYPKVFSAKGLRSHCRLAKPRDYMVESSELLPPFPVLADAGFLLSGPPAEPSACSVIELKAAGSVAKCCWSPAGSDLREPSSPPCIDDDFDAESILDEEMGEGLDSILGNSNSADDCDAPATYTDRIDPYLGYQPGSMYGLNITSALKRVGNGDWWCSPTVEIHNILSKPPAPPPEKPASVKTKKKKKKKLANLDEKTAAAPEAANPSPERETEDPTSSSSSPRPKSSAACLKPALSLNLNLERVLKEWADGGSPFSELPDSSESPTDIIAKLSDIDLFSETAGTSGMREASVLRYKEKRRARLFSKKIRYQVPKVNAEVGPRMKENGRFVKKDDEKDQD